MTTAYIEQKDRQLYPWFSVILVSSLNIPDSGGLPLAIFIDDANGGVQPCMINVIKECKCIY